MGACFSSVAVERIHDSHRPRHTTANVISTNGDLRQYPVPVTVSRVLQMELSPSSSWNSSPGSAKYFVCNSDRLYYEDYITPLDAEDELQPNQIYFVLPVSKLQHRLSASDMAALAVKASVALQKSSSNFSKGRSSSASSRRGSRNGGQNNKARISPILEEVNNQRVSPSVKGKPAATAGLGLSRSVSVRKLQRYSLKRPKMAVRPFRIRLTTIYEGSDLQFH